MENTPRSVRIWLLLICVHLVAMVTLGGVTRLTGSGLSITDWKPIMGAIPPLNLEEWEVAFSKYKEIPQFKLINSSMSLPEFKVIFFWEWFHRLFGRWIGLFTFIPAIYFFWKGQLSPRLRNRVALGLVLGGLQGFMGWFMVASGLTERTSVSHLRLAAHLNLAFIILFYFVWLTRETFQAKELPSSEESRARAIVRPYFPMLVPLYFLQMIYGAFVAGMKAGLIFNTYPKMDGNWFPPNFWSFEPALENLVYNPASIQWIHRTLGLVILASSMGLWIKLLRQKAPRGPIRRFTTGLAHLTGVQFVLGVATLLYSVPVALGVVHQLGGALIIVFIALLGQSLTQRVRVEIQT